MTIDAARLRALCVESQNERGEFLRARINLSLEGDAILALLAERDALEKLKDDGWAALRDYRRQVTAESNKMLDERDALAAMLREAQSAVRFAVAHGGEAWERLSDKIGAALDESKGGER